MRLAHPIIVAAASVVLATAAGCGAKGDADEARRSLYDTDFAVVYGATLDVVRDLYPNLADDPGKGKISTAWQQVHYSNTGFEDPKSIQAQDRALGYDPNVQAGDQSTSLTAPNSLAYKRYFIRFDVTVAGGRPWRIRVVGHAQEWEPGNAVATDLKGPATPHWLPGRTDALILAIHNRLKQYAIRMQDPEVDVIDAPPAIDVTAYGPVPAEAGHRLGEVRDAISRRDYDGLRVTVASDVVWSLGADPGIDQAFVMWQADPAILEGMSTVIAAGCRGSETEVTCPPAASEAPGYTGWRLTLTKRAEGWLVTSFVQGD